MGIKMEILMDDFLALEGTEVLGLLQHSSDHGVDISLTSLEDAFDNDFVRLIDDYMAERGMLDILGDRIIAGAEVEKKSPVVIAMKKIVDTSTTTFGTSGLKAGKYKIL